jgi:hypothetical protein
MPSKALVLEANFFGIRATYSSHSLLRLWLSDVDVCEHRQLAHAVVPVRGSGDLWFGRRHTVRGFVGTVDSNRAPVRRLSRVSTDSLFPLPPTLTGHRCA